MMSLARVSVHMGRTYYANENYYSREQGVAHSEWFGRGAATLKLEGKVCAGSFQDLLEGNIPGVERAVRRDSQNKTNEARAAVDLTFSAPKSVSLACFLGGDQRLDEAHQRAVRFALGVAEERYAWTRSGSKANRQVESSGNLIVAQFHHDTSRAKDPQLHTHCVAINAIQRSDGEWRSLHNDGLYAHSKLIGLIYQNELAKEVRRLGYGVEIKSNGTFEIEGYTQDQLRSFSKRREQIEELGAETQKEARLVVNKNRPGKGKEVSREDLRSTWESEARSLGIVHPSPKKSVPGEKETDLSEACRKAVCHATERDVRFRKEKVEQRALEENLGRVNWPQLQHELRTSERQGHIIACDKGQYTTLEAMVVEDRILAHLSHGKSRFDSVASGPLELPQTLTAGQKSALEVSLQSTDQFLAWQGVAGAGKTFAMNILREKVQAQGLTVRGFAPSAEAARVLEKEGHLKAETVASLLVSNQENFPKAGREIWIVDEAGLLSAKDCEKLMNRAVKEDARVIFVGDTKQLSAVEAGNPFRLLQEHGITSAHLTESRRQKSSELKAAVDAFAQGKTHEGLEKIKNDICELKRETTRVRHAATEYLKLSSEERSKTLVLAGTNRERALITQEIRSGLKERGELGQGELVQTLHAKDLTRAEIRSASRIEVGDALLFHRSYQECGLKKGDTARVAQIDPQRRRLHLSLPDERIVAIEPSKTDGFTVYEVRDLELAQGDLVRWRKNDRERGLRNGQDCVFEGRRNDAYQFATRSGQRFEVPVRSLLPADHNYVSTVYASQGKTCERALISVDKTFGREALYVALSRAKQSVTIFTEDKEGLWKQASQSRAKVSAFDVVAEEHRSLRAAQERATKFERLQEQREPGTIQVQRRLR